MTKVPAGYIRLADGQKCSCLYQWQSWDGALWCCQGAGRRMPIMSGSVERETTTGRDEDMRREKSRGTEGHTSPLAGLLDSLVNLPSDAFTRLLDAASKARELKAAMDELRGSL